MTAEQIYLAWAPQDLLWSRWVKPVLFAHLRPHGVPQASPELSIPLPPTWFATASTDAAVVVDLPGVQSVLWGLSLARAGFRPIPLFNSVPGGSDLTKTAIEMGELMDALARGAELLPATQRPSAPPAFLLDSRRRGAGAVLVPEMFDNRSISLPTDFPSANLLLSQGRRRVIIIQQGAGAPQADLCHTLRRWQQAGIGILAASSVDSTAPVPITIGRPKWFRHMWYGMLARLGLRRSPLGGYGGFIPAPSAG